MASGASDNTIKIWDVENKKLLVTFDSTKYQGHTQPVNALAALNNGLLASGSEDKTIKFWNITSGSLIRNLLGHTGSVYYSVDLLSDGQTFLSGSYDQTIKLWNVTNGQILKTINSSLSIRSLTVLVNLTVRGKRNNAFFLNFKTSPYSEY